MSTPRYRSAPPSLSGSAISVVKATTPCSPSTKSSGTAVMSRFSHPGCRLRPPVGNPSANGRGVALPRGNGGQERSDRGMTTRDNEHLARMRVEYGSVEKDGSGDLDADWLAAGWGVVLRKWLDDTERARVAAPNA